MERCASPRLFRIGREAPAAAAGPTPVCGNLAVSTWTLAGSPYVVCGTGVTVPATATLVIQPGVTIQFTSTASLAVAGTLNAIVTATQPITFTGGVAAAGSWRGLSVDHSSMSPAVANLDFAAFDYGGVSGSSSAEIFSTMAWSASRTAWRASAPAAACTPPPAPRSTSARPTS